PAVAPPRPRPPRRRPTTPAKSTCRRRGAESKGLASRNAASLRRTRPALSPVGSAARGLRGGRPRAGGRGGGRRTGRERIAGEWNGVFHAIDAATGHDRWQVQTGDQHAISYGKIVSSAAVGGASPTTGDPIVFFGAGGSLYALDTADGSPVWAVDTDPDQPAG